jgi:undecaprenyl-diphosphatase
MFFWHRLTPGQLGLELTTLLAVLSVGTFAFVGEAITLAHHTLAPADQDALNLAQDLYSPVLVDVARVITVLGTLPVVGTAVVITALFALRRGQSLAAAALVGGLALTWAGVQITKAATGRSRPPGGLIEASGLSFPSGHAANSIGWIAVAVVLTRALPGVASRVSLVTIAIVVAALIGLTRVYLRVHWLSDVIGGWGFGMAIYALLGIAALVVAFVRNNEQLTTSGNP